MINLEDDDNYVRRGFEMFLTSAGMDHVSFENADDFLSAAKPEKKEILIPDLHLPGTSSSDLFKKLNEDGCHIPVMVVTAFDDPPSLEYCRKYSVRAYLRKPVDGDALIDTKRFLHNLFFCIENIYF